MMPRHSEWKKLKKEYGIGAGAVSGVNIGKALDTYNTRKCKKPSEHLAMANDLFGVLDKYLKGLKEKQVAKGRFAEFKKVFMKDYLANISGEIKDLQAMSGSVDGFLDKISKLSVGTLKLGTNPDLTTLQKYRQGPVRGLLTMIDLVKQLDTKLVADLRKLWGDMDGIINKLGADTPQATLDKVAKLAAVTLKKTQELLKKAGLV